MEIEWSSFMLPIELSVPSRSLVTWDSTSSGPTPGYSVITAAIGNFISGIRSTAILDRVKKPRIIITDTRIIIVTGLFTEKSIIFII